MRLTTLSVLAFAALASCDSKEEGAKSPAATGDRDPAAAKVAKHPWASFKKGSFAKMKSVSEMEIAGNKTKTEMTLTYTLKDVTADEAILETETIMANVPPHKQEMKMPLKSPEGKSAAEAPKLKTGTEEIEVGGKKLKCTWTETETEASGAKMVTKVYTNEEVPGFTVKTITKNPTMTATMELVEWSAK